jgi:hypothetical protein
MKLVLSLIFSVIPVHAWATNIPTNITSYSTNTTQNPPVTLCSNTAPKVAGVYYQLGSGYQVPGNVTFYSAQVCGSGSPAGQSIQLGFTRGPYVDGTTFLSSPMIITTSVSFLNTAGIPGAALTGCQVVASNFEGASYPVMKANTNGTYTLCVTGVNE